MSGGTAGQSKTALKTSSLTCCAIAQRYLNNKPNADRMATVGVTCQVDALVQDIGCLMLSGDEGGYSSRGRTTISLPTEIVLINIYSIPSQTLCPKVDHFSTMSHLGA